MRASLTRSAIPRGPGARSFRGNGLLCFAVTFLAALQLAPPANAADESRRHLGNGAATALSINPGGAQSAIAAPSHLVKEGGAQRQLWMDPSRVAEFGTVAGSDHPAIRQASPADLSAANRSAKTSGGTSMKMEPDAAGGQAPPPTNLSPVFLDASGRPRALPGGVIVALKSGLPPEQAREQLQSAGLEPLRQIGEKMWLVQSPAGLASLELAERLDADERFEFAQPNWWHPRTTK
jgi:hypothetical protein